MAGGREFSKTQRKIIDRYYDHKDTIASTKLSEIVTELYLASDAKAQDRLWKRAEQAMKTGGVQDATIRRIVDGRDLESAAQLANRMSGGKR